MNRNKLKLKTNKACLLLGMFLLNRIQQQEDKKTITELANAQHYNYDNILIEETSKPIIHNKKKKRQSVSTKVPLTPSNINERKLNLIVVSLAHFKGFVRYIKYQGLTNDDLIKTAEVLQHEFYKKGSYIFRENDRSNAFYGVISGKVSIRKSNYIDYTQLFREEVVKSQYEGIKNTYINKNNKHNIHEHEDSINSDISSEYFISKSGIDDNETDNNNNNNNNNDNSFYNFGDEFEQEVVTASKGMCFGEWGVVYNIPRTASAYCPEDTHVFKLNKEHFDEVLASKFFKSDMNKIKFILKKLPILNNNYNFKYLLTKITPVFFDKGDYVYTQFDKAKSLYLLYQGECSYVYLHDAMLKDDFIMRKHDIKLLTSLSVGALTGLESYKKEGLNYEGNLLVTRDFTVLLTINIDYIMHKVRDFDLFVKPLYETQKKILETSMKNLHQNTINDKTNGIDKYGTVSMHDQQQNLEMNFNEIMKEINCDKNNHYTKSKNAIKHKKIIINRISLSSRNNKSKKKLLIYKDKQTTGTLTERTDSIHKQYEKNLIQITNNNSVNKKRGSFLETLFTMKNINHKKSHTHSQSQSKSHSQTRYQPSQKQNCFGKHINSVLIQTNLSIRNSKNKNCTYICSTTNYHTEPTSLTMSTEKNNHSYKKNNKIIKRQSLSKLKSLKTVSALSNYSTYLKNANDVKKNENYGKNGKELTKGMNYDNMKKGLCNCGEVTIDMLRTLYKRNEQRKKKIYDTGMFTLPLVSGIDMKK